MKKLPLVILAIPFLSGCMSVLGTVEGGACFPYAGVRSTTHLIGYPQSEPWVLPMIVDLPFSLVLDTALLPLTATRAAVADTCKYRGLL